MRYQPGIDYLRGTQCKRLTRLLTLETLWGQTAYFTTHDRALTGVDGNLYEPIAIGGWDDDVAEGAIRGSRATAIGLIDGTNIVINDVAGGRYRGAKVTERIVDWKRPHIVVSEQVRTITAIRFSNKGWTAQLESLSSRLRKPGEARFQGQFTSGCPYRLGGKFCGVDLSGMNWSGASVASVQSARTSFTLDALPFTPTAPNWFAEGEIEWLWDPASDSGTNTTAVLVGDATLTDTAASYTTDEFVGDYLRVFESGSTTEVAEYFLIKSNTATVITIDGLFEQAHAIGRNYDICPPSEKSGVVSPIATADNGTGAVELFLPTHIDIVAGESGVLRVGCNGLFGTCRDKFSNQLNFGGIDVNAPDASDLTAYPEDA